ncbi:hypothetical protein Vafri_7393, partial [Volvox africanus]
LEVDQLDVENKGCMWRNDARDTAGTIGHVRADRQRSPLTLRHLGDANVPALNHFPHAQTKIKWGAAVTTAVKLSAVLQGACVVHEDLLSLLRAVNTVSWLSRLDVD